VMAIVVAQAAQVLVVRQVAVQLVTVIPVVSVIVMSVVAQAVHVVTMRVGSVVATTVTIVHRVRVAHPVMRQSLPITSLVKNFRAQSVMNFAHCQMV